MTWAEVRELYPDQYIKFEIVESHVIGNKEFVDDVAIIKAISDEKEAKKEFINCKEGQLVLNIIKTKQGFCFVPKALFNINQVISLSINPAGKYNNTYSDRFGKLPVMNNKICILSDIP